MTLLAFLDETALLADAAPGQSLSLTGTEAKHATVRRVRPGEHVLVTGGDGHQAEVAVTAVTGDRLDAEIVALTRAPVPDRELVLVQALARSGRDLQAVETAVELGVDRVVPWQADRCVVRWQGEKAAKGRAKWKATVREAVKQSRRPRVPAVDAAAGTAALAEAVRAATDEGATVLVLHEAAPGSFRAALDGAAGVGAGTASTGIASTGTASTGAVWLLVGPEGGITGDELEALTAAGGQACRLGPEVLRSATAGPAALAALCARLGRWD